MLTQLTATQGAIQTTSIFSYDGMNRISKYDKIKVGALVGTWTSTMG